MPDSSYPPNRCYGRDTDGAFVVPTGASLVSELGGTIDVSAGTFTVAAGQIPATAIAGAVTNAGAVTTGGTIAPTVGAFNSAVRAAPAGAVTGLIVTPGTINGQQLSVINESVAASTMTFAVAGTSNVADGAGSALAGLTARILIWDTTALLWFRAA